MQKILDIFSKIIYIIYKPVLDKYIKNSIIFSILEFIIYLVIRLLLPDLSEFLYKIYCGVYLINSLFIIYKILNKLRVEFKILFITIGIDKIEILQIYILAILIINICKLLFSYWYLNPEIIFIKYLDTGLSVIIWLIIIDMIYGFRREIKFTLDIIRNNFDQKTIRLLDIYLIIYILFTGITLF